MLRPEPGLKVSIDDDGAAILNVRGGVISMLNRTGAYVWSGLTEGKNVADIVSALASETDGNVKEVESDVQAFVESLSENNLITD